jgi:hypothetical protein
MTANMFWSPRRWILLALLLAKGVWSRYSEGVVMHSHASSVAGDADDKNGAGDTSSPYNTTMYASNKCRKYNYMYDEGGEYRVHNAEYKRVNDLQSSCKSRATNARGSYTSKGMCYFAFHTIPDDKVPSNRMSEACTDDNLEDESMAAKDDPLGHPVRGWPDACVGDFPRCYKLDRESDERVVMGFICSKKLEIPAGVTHLSVDCTADKAELKKMLKNGALDEDTHSDPYMRQHQREQREYYAFIAALAVAACACGFFCLLLVHRYAFKPYLKALKRTRSDPELAGLTSSDSSRS